MATTSVTRLPANYSSWSKDEQKSYKKEMKKRYPGIKFEKPNQQPKPNQSQTKGISTQLNTTPITRGNLEQDRTMSIGTNAYVHNRVEKENARWNKAFGGLLGLFASSNNTKSKETIPQQEGGLDTKG